MENLNKEKSKALAIKLITDAELEPASIDAVSLLPSFMEKLSEYEKAAGRSFAAIPQDVRSELIFRRLQQLVNIALLNRMERTIECGQSPGHMGGMAIHSPMRQGDRHHFLHRATSRHDSAIVQRRL